MNELLSKLIEVLGPEVILIGLLIALLWTCGALLRIGRWCFEQIGQWTFCCFSAVAGIGIVYDIGRHGLLGDGVYYALMAIIGVIGLISMVVALIKSIEPPNKTAS